MEKLLRNVLVLALGLTTTIASAQWNAESRTRIDNTDSDTRSATQRLTVASTWGGVHASADVNYNIDNSAATHSVYEAYASTNLMGASLTMGRQDLSYGSGALMSSNDWGTDRYTNDGISVGMDLSQFNVNMGTLGGVNTDNNYLNASANIAGASVNILMMNEGDASAHGYDFSYTMMGGNVTVNASMNSDYEEDEMTSYGVSYSGLGGITVSASQTTYDGAFNMSNTALSGGWANGNMGYLNAGDEDMAIGISGEMAGITLGYTMHTVSNDDVAEDREATVMTLGYNLSDNAHLGIARFTDSNGDMEQTWLTLTIGL